MPYKDPEKRKEAVKKSREKHLDARINVGIPKGDGSIYKALVEVTTKENITIAEYMRQATIEKLQRDNVVAVTASPAELRAIGITKSHRSRPRRRIRLGVIPEKPDKP